MVVRFSKLIFHVLGIDTDVMIGKKKFATYRYLGASSMVTGFLFLVMGYPLTFLWEGKPNYCFIIRFCNWWYNVFGGYGFLF